MLLLFLHITFLLSFCVARQSAEINDGDRVLYNEGLYEGDIAGIDPTDRNAIIDKAKLWPNGVVYYQIRYNDFKFKDGFIDNITLAMKTITKQTGGCITFKNGMTQKGNHILIHRGNGCWSMVGMQKDRQSLSLDDGCHYLPLIVHELMHAIGFYHEQTRSDRDDYIYIYLENVHPSLRYNFKKLEPQDNLLFVPYDYESVLQYGEYAFSYNGRKTIVPKQSDVTIQSIWTRDYTLTYYDVMAVQDLYSCNRTAPVTPAPPIDVKCNFTKNWCIFRNGQGYKQKFNRTNEDGNWFLETDLSKSNEKFTRIISNFIRLNGVYGACLSFNYKLSEGGFGYIGLLVDDGKIREIWRPGNLQGTNGWLKVRFTVHYTQDVRFVFDVMRQYGTRTGKFSIDNFSYIFGEC